MIDAYSAKFIELPFGFQVLHTYLLYVLESEVPTMARIKQISK